MVLTNLNPVRNWIRREYPRPEINPEWLQGCCTALQENDPNINTRDLIHAVNLQLLLSSLSDSCLPQTGLPVPELLEDLHGETLFQKDHCLVMVMSIMEIGHSAFQLQTTMENRKEALSGVRRIRRIRNPQADGDGADEEEAEDDDDDEAIPPYPRGMLRLEVSDGFHTLKAMEYQRIDGLTLGETALGSKILLKGVQIRRGILMLTPANAVLKGQMVEEIEMHQGRLFQNALLRAMGKPELPLEDEMLEQDPPVPEAHRQPAQPPIGFDDDRFSEYEGDMEYDVIASGIDLSAPGPSRTNPARHAVAQPARREEEEKDFYPSDDDLEALMVMQERAQAKAQAPARPNTTKPAAAKNRDSPEEEEEWEVLAAMEAEAAESNTKNPLRNDAGPKPPARLTLGLPFQKAEASSSRAASSLADEEDTTTRSRFFGKKSDQKQPEKQPAQAKLKKGPITYADDEEDELFPPMEYVYNQESEDEDYVPDDTSPPPKRKFKTKGATLQFKTQASHSRAGERGASGGVMEIDDDDDDNDDDLEDSQKENRPALAKRKAKGSAPRGSVPRGKIKPKKQDPDDDEVIEISD